MDWYFWVLIAVAFILLATAATAFVCFYMVFYSKGGRKPLDLDNFELPEGEVYEEFRGDMIKWVRELRTLEHEDITITSFDGLKLCGSYYEYKPGAITELLFHGYKGCAERDLSGGVERCFRLGRNALIINQRASGPSEGRVISFGVNEHRDCLSWIDYATKRFGKETKLVITGVSMGAATVMLAAGCDLPDNVVCVLADCGYTSQREIISKVIDEMKLPSKLLYPFVKLGARIYGGFNLDEVTPIEAMEKCRLPIIFIHGDTDDFVPANMSQRLYDKCVSDKKSLVFIKNAGHGLAFPRDRDGYVKALADFEKEWLS